jgi:two-component system sensor histidine kinase YesM
LNENMWIKSILPQTLRLRLFIAFVLLIHLPLIILNVYNYQKIEKVMQQKASEKSYEQLVNMNNSLEEVMNTAFKTYILLGQDALVSDILLHPDNRNPLERKYVMENKFISINNSFFLNTPFYYYTVFDLSGNEYASYQPRKALQPSDLFKEKHFKTLTDQNELYQWITEDNNYVAPDLTNSRYLLSLYASVKDNNYITIGMARVSIDYSDWFRYMMHKSPDPQDYFIINQQGINVAQSNLKIALTAKTIQQIINKSGSGYFIDNASKTMINYSSIPKLGWFMINSVPMDILFGEINRIKQQYFLTFILLTISFVIITFIISNTITRPLYHLQNKMKEAVAKNFKVKLPEQKYKGEILQITRTYNGMLDDMNDLIQKLKIEERQKEAVHFQMLIAQMNPHFLLNTLNIMKWIALRHHVHSISDICISLGQLLETSLNYEVELIHLQKEMELVQAFIQIHNYKQKIDLDYSVNYEESLKYVLIPKFSIQPLVENAIIHGFSKQDKAGQIRVRVYKQQLSLYVEVEDNGIGFTQSKKQQTLRKRKGIGLDNIQQRLKLLFKLDSDFDIKSNDKGTLITFRIPLLISVPYIEGGDDYVEGADR